MVTTNKPYYTLVMHRTVPEFTNQWNTCPAGWNVVTRGNFSTELAACRRAAEILPHGAPFTVRLVSPE